MGELDDRVVAISGAGGTLGPAVASRLANEGATVALADVSEEALERVVGTLVLPEGRIDARAVDLLDAEAAAGWAEGLESRFGGVDCVLHLVGGWRGGEPIESASLEDYEWLHDLLVRTTQHVSRAFHGPLSRSSHGRFLLVSSSQAQSPAGTNASYAATKAAAESWTLALADSFRSAETAATANLVVVNAIGEDDPEHTAPAEIASACLFLCSDGAARMNGKRLPLYP